MIMKRISLIAHKRTMQYRGEISTNQRTGAHCPITGYWKDQDGRVRHLTEGTVFPGTQTGPSMWTPIDERSIFGS